MCVTWCMRCSSVGRKARATISCLIYFQAYEKGIALFKWPNVYDIWNTYLTKFLKRYGGSKLERTRDLFEQCLENCPAKFAKCLYLLYAKLEEEHGLARHAMGVYERATSAVLPEEMFEVSTLCIVNLFVISTFSLRASTEIILNVMIIIKKNHRKPKLPPIFQNNIFHNLMFAGLQHLHQEGSGNLRHTQNEANIRKSH